MSTIDNRNVGGSAREEASITLETRDVIDSALYACVYHRKIAVDLELGSEELVEALDSITAECKARLPGHPIDPLEISDQDQLEALYEAVEYVVEGSLPGPLNATDQELLEPVYRELAAVLELEEPELETDPSRGRGRDRDPGPGEYGSADIRAGDEIVYEYTSHETTGVAERTLPEYVRLESGGCVRYEQILDVRPGGGRDE